MGLARTMLTALLLSVWVMVHAVYVANVDRGAEDQLLPLRVPSVFRMRWFRTFVETHMDVERLRVEAPPTSSFWTSFAKKGSLSSPRSFYDAGNNPAEGKPWQRPLSWIVSAMTMAEFVSFMYFVWAIIWRTVLRPVTFVLFFLALLVLVFYCVKGYYFVIGPALFQQRDPAVLPYLNAVDDFLQDALSSLWGWSDSFLSWIDRLFAVLVTPASVLEKEQSLHAKGEGIEAEIFSFLQAAKQSLYAVFTGGHNLSQGQQRSSSDLKSNWFLVSFLFSATESERTSLATASPPFSFPPRVEAVLSTEQTTLPPALTHTRVPALISAVFPSFFSLYSDSRRVTEPSTRRCFLANLLSLFSGFHLRAWSSLIFKNRRHDQCVKAVRARVATHARKRAQTIPEVC
ncbi:putative transmembrane protein [Toxoplasma gondii RUB]|uniref:Putative transmembrane protein n=1 Tax=Toxoplasma gondii RUB TaxID=935652 RepID=A0A086LK64_TOXGO|nr:putative transmembrane protein [Toxoplasma gondii RUB]